MLFVCPHLSCEVISMATWDGYLYSLSVTHNVVSCLNTSHSILFLSLNIEETYVSVLMDWCGDWSEATQTCLQTKLILKPLEHLWSYPQICLPNTICCGESINSESSECLRFGQGQQLHWRHACWANTQHLSNFLVSSRAVHSQSDACGRE